MAADTLATLTTDAAFHKREIRRHRHALQVTVRTIEEFKKRMDALGIQNGAEKGDSHGPSKATSP